jgi:hypothetical protein
MGPSALSASLAPATPPVCHSPTPRSCPVAPATGHRPCPVPCPCILPGRTLCPCVPAACPLVPRHVFPHPPTCPQPRPRPRLTPPHTTCTPAPPPPRLRRAPPPSLTPHPLVQTTPLGHRGRHLTQEGADAKAAQDKRKASNLEQGGGEGEPCSKCKAGSGNMAGHRYVQGEEGRGEEGRGAEGRGGEGRGPVPISVSVGTSRVCCHVHPRWLTLWQGRHRADFSACRGILLTPRTHALLSPRRGRHLGQAAPNTGKKHKAN